MGSAQPAGAGLRPAYAAVRGQVLLVAILVLLAAVGWWWSIHQIAGMDQGPWSRLGTLGWFITVWVVMMAAMMFPSVAPTVALYSRMCRSRWRPLVFVIGYLATWTAAGAVAFGAGTLAGRAWQPPQWDSSARLFSGTTLLLAAVYELTPLKRACLNKCRSPLGLLLGSWRDGWAGALRMGVRNGAWCVGCCWALMASLFALGVMSPLWMAVVAVLITVEKLLPWRRTATYVTALVLFVLGVLVLAAPQSVPGLDVPTPGLMPVSLAG